MSKLLNEKYADRNRREIPSCGGNCFKTIYTELHNYLNAEYNVAGLRNGYDFRKNTFRNITKTFICGTCFVLVLSYDKTLEGRNSYMIRLFKNLEAAKMFIQGRHLLFTQSPKKEYIEYMNMLHNPNVVFSTNYAPIETPKILKSTLFRNFYGVSV
jgi:hypothetical protein